MVQTCIVHLIRNSLDYAGWKDHKTVAAALRPIYAAAIKLLWLALCNVLAKSVGRPSTGGRLESACYPVPRTVHFCA
jgi:transposase-like protein